MKVAFAGTPDFAETILRGLLASEHEVGVVISQPDTRRGRGRKLTAPPVAELAVSQGIPLLQPHLIGEIADRIRQQEALVVAAYGQILRPDTLYATEFGAWNVHASLLPAYRGAAPVERAIMNGEKQTGISIMAMEEGLDSGPIAFQSTATLDPDADSGELSAMLAQLGARAIVETLSMIETNNYTLKTQDHSKATYAHKLSAEDRIVSWDLPSRRIHDQIRALAPKIGARTFHPAFNGPVKILRSRVLEDTVTLAHGTVPGNISTEKDYISVQCGEGALRIDRLQISGGKPLEAKEFLRGNELTGAFTDPPG